MARSVYGGSSSLQIKLSLDVYKACKDIAQYDAETQDAIRKALLEGVQNMYRTAVMLAPYRTGEMKRSLRYEVGRASARLYSEDFKVRFAEFGARGVVVHPSKYKRAMALPFAERAFAQTVNIPARAAHPFMRPAVDAEKPKLETAIREAVLKNAKDD